MFLDVINSAQCPAAIRHNALAVSSMQHPALLCRFSVSTHMSNVLKLAVQFFNEKRGGINVGEQLPLQMWRGEPSCSATENVWAGVEPSSCIGGRRFALSITTLDDESKAPKVRFARRGGVGLRLLVQTGQVHRAFLLWARLRTFRALNAMICAVSCRVCTINTGNAMLCALRCSAPLR